MLFLLLKIVFSLSPPPLHYGRFRCIEIFLSENEAKLLGNSVCQNLNVSACFVCVLASNVGVIYVSLLYYYYYLHLLLLSALYLNSKAEGFATLRANQGIVIDWIEQIKNTYIPCLCKHVISRLVQPSTFILCCTNCKTTILSLKQIPTHQSHKNYPYFTTTTTLFVNIG